MSQFTNEQLALFDMLAEAIGTIHKKEERTKRPCGGLIDCPKCGKRLSYTIASNNHVHGCCETEHCLRWME